MAIYAKKRIIDYDAIKIRRYVIEKVKLVGVMLQFNFFFRFLLVFWVV